MAKRGRPEIIEVLPADEARPFEPASRASSTAIAPSPSDAASTPRRTRRWWIVPVAIAGVAAVVVGASVLTDSSAPDSARSTGETKLSGSTDLTPVVLPLVPATPDGYRIVGVVQAMQTASTAARPVRQLWATHVDQSLLASWLEITASPDGLPTDIAGDRRVAVPGGIAVLGTRPDGDLSIAGPLAGGGAASIDSSGVSRATLVELLGSLRFDGQTLTSSDVRFGGMFQQVAADDGAPAIAARHASLTVSYDAVVASANKRNDLTVTVGPLGPGYDETARQFFSSHRDDVTVNGQQAVLGNDEREFGTQSVTFERAGLRITIAGTAPRSVLLDAVQSVHVATGAELAALLSAGPPPPEVLAPAIAAGVQVAGGDVGDGRQYAIGIQDVGDGQAVVSINTSDGVIASTSVTEHDSYIATVASPTMTGLVAFIAADAADARLVVKVGDPAAPATLAAVPVRLADGTLVAAVGFDEMQPYTAQIVLPDGRTLSTAAG